MELTGKTTRHLIASYVRALLNGLFPARCIVCQGAVEQEEVRHGKAGHDKAGFQSSDICAGCLDEMPLNKHCCPRCAVPLASEYSNGDHPNGVICGRCIKQPPAFDYSYSLFRYEGTIVSLIHQLKFSQKIGHARSLGALLAEGSAEYVSKNGLPDGLLPVPLHRRRLRQRGFNQSSELAHLLASRWSVPIMLDEVERGRKTESQTGLDAKQRKKNIRGAFTLASEITFDHVLIIDDVVTTGSTVNELARLLKKAGVRRIGVLSVARAPMKQ
jgi:ComF family protein